ncbi:MAG: hypothetical protein AAF549_00165 [Pseudomonadota bacterium]
MNDTVHVESPKADAGEGILLELERQANASAVSAEVIASGAEAEQASNAGAVAEEGRAEAGREAEARTKSTPTAESTLATEVATNALAPGAQVALAGADMLSEKRSNPLNSLDTKGLQKKLGGMGGNKFTSFEDGFKTIRSNPNGSSTRSIDTGTRGRGLFEKSSHVSGSLKGQSQSATSSWKRMEESSAGLAQTREYAISCGVANQKVLAQIQAVRATPQPGANMGGGAAPARTLENNKIAQGPTGPTINETVTDDGTTTLV